jgi:hypothetical protein
MPQRARGVQAAESSAENENTVGDTFRITKQCGSAV